MLWSGWPAKSCVAFGVPKADTFGIQPRFHQAGELLAYVHTETSLLPHRAAGHKGFAWVAWGHGDQHRVGAAVHLGGGSLAMAVCTAIRLYRPRAAVLLDGDSSSLDFSTADAYQRICSERSASAGRGHRFRRHDGDMDWSPVAPGGEHREGQAWQHLDRLCDKGVVTSRLPLLLIPPTRRRLADPRSVQSFSAVPPRS